MKAEHRHELKTNDLAQSLVTFGDYVKEYGGRVVLGLIIGILVVVLIRNRIQSSRQEAENLRNALAVAREQVDRLNTVALDQERFRLTVTPDEVKDVPRMIGEIKSKASDKSIRAEVLAIEGDYYWGLARFPALLTDKKSPPPTPEERQQMLIKAREAYQQVVQQFPDQTASVIAARMGLAAIAENNREWSAAKEQLEAVVRMPEADRMHKELAEFQLKRVDQLQKPMLVGKVMEREEFPNPTPQTQPATKPAETTKPTAETPKPAVESSKPKTETTKATETPKPAPATKSSNKAQPDNKATNTPGGAKPTTRPAGK